MILYYLYMIGYFLVMILPLKVAYGLARCTGTLCYHIYGASRCAVHSNLRVALGASRSDKEIETLTKQVFVNFAKYLVDFFRFSRIDKTYIEKFVKIDGAENLSEARSKGKGVVILSAHLGNWELGGLVLATICQPIGAVALTHKEKHINDFFTRQRKIGKIEPIEFGAPLRKCFSLLKSNGFLALLGDRDFSQNGLYVDFFGRPTLIPRGPAAFSCRFGSAIVSAFMIRKPDDTFHLIIGKPIYPSVRGKDDESMRAVMKQYTSVIESYVRKYPDQWHMFREVWNNNA